MRPKLALGCVQHDPMPRTTTPHASGRALVREDEKNAQNRANPRRGRRLSRRPAASRDEPRALRSLQRVQSTAQRRQVPILHARGERAGEQMCGWSWEGGWGRLG